jgi:hypothetical protein
MPALQAWWAAIAPFLFTLLGLILVQFVLGVAVAVAINKDFQVKKLPDFAAFYGPKVLAWLLIEALRFVPEDVLLAIPLGSYMTLFSKGFGLLIFGTVALAAVGGILGHLQAIGVMPAGVLPAMKSVGMPSTLSLKSGDGAPTGGSV